MRVNPKNRLLLPAALLTCAPLAWTAGETDAKQLFTHAMGAAECAPTAEHGCNAACEDAWGASQELGRLLVKSPAAFEVVAPLMRATFEQGGAGRDKLLGFLAECGSEGCQALGAELFAAAPQEVTEIQMLALAESGCGPLAQALLARVESGRTETCLPAAWLAFGGDATGKSALQAAAGAAVEPDSAIQVLVSAAALEALGEERALPAARARVHAAVLAALDAGELADARSMALAAELLQEPLERAARASAKGYGAGQFRVSPLEGKLGWHLKKRGAELVGADQVFELIESITPLS